MPRTALDAVEGHGGVMRDDLRARPGHASVPRRRGRWDVGEMLIRVSGKSELWVSPFGTSIAMSACLGVVHTIHGLACAADEGEPPRLSRRLPLLRGWSHEQTVQVFPGSA